MWFTLALALTLPSMSISADCTSSKCSGTVNTSASLQFIDNPDLHPFRQPGRYLSMDCCADGFTDMEWYFSHNKSSPWQPWPWTSCEWCAGGVDPYHELCGSNQTLSIISTNTDTDTGWYLCNASNSDTQQYIQRRFRVVVADCDDLDGNIQVFQQPGLTQKAVIGSNLTLTCGGNFGCPTADKDRHANWSRVSPDGKAHPLLPDADKHYRIVFSHGVEDTTVSSILTVKGVRMSDFNQTYICHLSTNTSVLTWNLTIHKQDVQEKLKWMEIVVSVGVVGGFALLLGIAVVVYLCYKPQVHYRFHRMRGHLLVRGPNEEDFHDTAVIHGTSDKIADFAKEEIIRPLQNEGYDVFTHESLPDSATVIEPVDAIERCMSVILVLNAAEMSREEMKLLVSVAMDCHGTRMVVIEMKDKRSTGSLREEVLDNYLNDLPKVLKTVPWYGSRNMSRRQKDNLLYTIKSSLPEPRGSVEEGRKSRVNPRQTSSSSTARLLPGGDQSVSSVSGADIEMRKSNSEHPDFADGEGNDEVFSVDVQSRPVSKSRPTLRRSDRVSSSSPFVKQLSDDSGYAKSPCFGSEPNESRIPFKDASHDNSAVGSDGGVFQPE
ncbi:uncharacterized protein LOC124121978 isoform X2 [Haliotis rufescens]|uniref:uncharacterized protein LOC124121978 isoform X2 n=1 Tax=Haliotis rufescens TaxID=6454 RepID=UPI00201F6777|nr:uncharacterized protein LOC124121978 isoform X2 [Haliotis rufescens]XP_048244762.1 uncharacterized protein LOC124121978 isoform X2 [Haliotis rufescens]